jgi:hypothetical protein
MADCCLYDWFQDGQNLVEKFAPEHPPAAGSDERLLFDGHLRATYRILRIDSTVSGAGIYCHDLLNGGELFLMDVGMSNRASSRQILMATRTFPLGGCSIAGGAGLPIESAEVLSKILASVDATCARVSSGLGQLGPVAIRACLDAGAVERMRYAAIASEPHRPTLKAPKTKRK